MYILHPDCTRLGKISENTVVAHDAEGLSYEIEAAKAGYQRLARMRQERGRVASRHRAEAGQEE